MWRRILLTAFLTALVCRQLWAADVRSWAGPIFIKSLRKHYLTEAVLHSPVFTQNGGTVIAIRLTEQNQPLPDPNVIQPLKQHFEYVLPRTCVSAIAIGEDFKCTGPDKESLKCSGIVVTVRGKIDECLEINVVKDEKR